MREAFGRLAVQKLEVIYPEPDHGFAAQAHESLVKVYNEALSSWQELVGHASPLRDLLEPMALKDPRSVPVPEAACQCIVALLKTGTSELVVHGALADATSVADAIAQSKQLLAIELGEHLEKDERLSRAELDSVARLMQKGVKHCEALKHLKLNHVDILYNIPMLLSSTGTLPAWDSVQVEVHATQLGTVWMGLLDPLRGHSTLNRVAIRMHGFDLHQPDVLDQLTKVGKFCCTCPSLKDFKWDLGPLSEGALRVMSLWPKHGKLFGKQFHPDDDYKIFRSQAFRLQKFAMIGFPLAGVATCNFFDAIQFNEMLENLDFSGGTLEASAAQKFVRHFQKNTRLKTVEFPKLLQNYYLATSVHFFGELHGHLFGFRQGGLGSSANDGTHMPNDFELMDHENNPAFEAVRKLFNLKFKNQIDRILTAPQEVLNAKRRDDFRPNALADLQHDVWGFLNTAGAANGTHSFPPEIAVRITEMLDEDRALRTVVRLSEAHTAIDHHNLRESEAGPKKTPQHPDVKALVKVDNKDAVKRGDGLAAPLAVNEVNAQHANIQLLKAVQANDVQRVRKLIEEEKAIDFGGQAEKAATSDDMRQLFKRLKRPDKTPVGTSTETTTATSTATPTATSTKKPAD